MALTERQVRPQDAEEMRDCLIWLGRETRFIEDSGNDFYIEVVRTFLAPTRATPEARLQPVADFLRWLDYGDRLHWESSPPGWNGISFYYGDYGFSEAARFQCADDMVRFYREGE